MTRRHRTIYFNDARHYYLFVFEPPMSMQDAWVPVDECAGTAVDTFIYGVERSDGLFYPSRVGMRFGADMPALDSPAYWRSWENMQSLIERGLDPLQVLIDRAHDKGMDFIASLRMSGYGGINPDHAVGDHPQHGDFAHPEVGSTSSPCWRSWPPSTRSRGWSSTSRSCPSTSRPTRWKKTRQ